MKSRDYAVLSSAVSIAVICAWLVKASGLPSMAAGVVLLLLLCWCTTMDILHTALLSVALVFLLALCGLTIGARLGLIELLAFGVALPGLIRLVDRGRRTFQEIQSTALFHMGSGEYGPVRITTRYRHFPK